jgi:uncharacterized protein
MNKTPRPAITEFSQETSETIGYYVYGLIDPRKPATDPRRIFYVGKGKGQRCFSHAATEVGWNRKKNEPNPKLKRIRKIRKATGNPPSIQIIAHKLSEDEAYGLEAALISVLGTDANFVSGQHGSDYSLAVDEIEGLYSRPLKESAIKHRVLLVSLNGATAEKGYEGLRPFPDIKESEMPGRVLRYWMLSDRNADQVEYVIAVYLTLARRVFKVHQTADGSAKHKRINCGKNKKGHIIWKQEFRGVRCLEMERRWCNHKIVSSSGEVLTKFRWGVGHRLIGKEH